MHRLLLFSLVAAAAWAQTTPPAAPDTTDAEKALRARVQSFYQLQMDRKYRQAEALVAEDTKDWYYNSKKTEILGFSVLKVELLPGNTHAKVTLKAKSTLVVMGAGPLSIETPAVTDWKLENGEWVWYIDKQAASHSPFGQWKEVVADGKPAGNPALPSAVPVPDLGALSAQVKVDRTSVILSATSPEQIATISNGLPGDIDLTVNADPSAGISASLDKSHLAAGGQALLTIRKTGSLGTKGSVHVQVSPLDTQLDIQVSGN